MAKKKRRLPKYLTRVTPLSKTIALILFILLPFLGFYFGRVYQKALDQVDQTIVPVIKSTLQAPTTIPFQLHEGK